MGKKVLLRGEFGENKANKRDLSNQLKLKSKKHYQSDEEEDGEVVKLKQEEETVQEKEDDKIKKHHQLKLAYYDKQWSLNHYQMKYYLNCGFNLLIYGVGSKRNFVNRLVQYHLATDPCLVINGFHSGTTMKTITNPMIKFIANNFG